MIAVPIARVKTKAMEAKQEAYRGLILEAGERVFGARGYDDARVEEIAREAGLAVGTLYSVFRGKAEIYQSIHEAADRELLERSTRSGRALEDPLEVLLAGVRAYVEFFCARPDFLRMHLAEGRAWSTIEAAGGNRARTEAWEAGLEMLTGAFRRCIEAGIFIESDARLSARTMIAMQQVQLADWIEHGMKREPQELVEAMLAQVRRAFAAPDPTGADASNTRDGKETRGST